MKKQKTTQKMLPQVVRECCQNLVVKKLFSYLLLEFLTSFEIIIKFEKFLRMFMMCLNISCFFYEHFTISTKCVSYLLLQLIGFFIILPSPYTLQKITNPTFTIHSTKNNSSLEVKHTYYKKTTKLFISMLIEIICL